MEGVGGSLRRLMRVWSLVVGILALWVGVGLATSQPALAQESPADIATARELFREGLKLSREDRWEEARLKLEQSLSLKQTPLTYYTLAVAEKKSGHPVAALEHFKVFLAQPRNRKTEGFVPGAKKAVAELEGLVARVTIEVAPSSVPELEVKIDGEPIPEVALGRPRLVDPGEHEVVARAPGYVSARETFGVEAKKRASVTLTLTPSPDVSRGEEGHDGILLHAGVGLLAGGGAIGITGLVVGIIGAGEAADAPTRDGPEADAALEKALAGDILMGVGGAAAIAGFVLVIMDLTADDDASPAAGWRPWVSGEQLGLQLRF